MAQAMPNWFVFLRLEASLAMTFIRTAKLTPSAEGAARNRGNARKALTQIQKGLDKPAYYGLSEDEVVFLELCSAEIEVALAKF